MALGKIYRGKRVAGMKNWFCFCCNPFTSNRNGKVWSRRMVRRTFKISSELS